jgi:Secretory lipase
MIRSSILQGRRSIVTSVATTLSLSLALTGCGGGDPAEGPPPPDTDTRGVIVSTEEIKSYSREELAAILAQIGLPEIGEPTHGIHIHRILYRTPDVGGELTTTSGLLVVPDGEGPFPVLSDQHGTQVLKRLTITEPFTQTEMGGVALLFGAQGWVVGGADYLGLGVSEGLHPYYHAETEGSATLDFLTSVRQFSEERGIELTDELFLAGYSQGAHVTMALHQAIDAEPASEWEVVASAPMAGAYDLADVSFPAALTRPAPSSSMYVTYALLAYDRVYGIHESPADVLRAPYDALVGDLFDGSHEIGEIVAALPATPAELLQPSFVEGYLADEEHPLRALFRANDVLDWTPGAPIRLFHGKADVDVPFENAERALEVLAARGADVELVNVGDDKDHATASTPSYLAARDWFNSLRAGR